MGRLSDCCWEKSPVDIIHMFLIWELDWRNVTGNDEHILTAVCGLATVQRFRIPIKVDGTEILLCFTQSRWRIRDH